MRVTLNISHLSLGIIRIEGLRLPESYEPLPGLAPEDLGDIQVARGLYRAIGQDPTRNRPSSEALIRRLKKGQGLPRINALVDALNHCSAATGLPFGCYDLAKLEGEVTVRIGEEGEGYEGVGNRRVNVEGRYAVCDDEGPCGNPTMDSKRTATAPETTGVLIVIFAPPDHPHDRMEEVVEKLTGAAGERRQRKSSVPDVQKGGGSWMDRRTRRLVAALVIALLIVLGAFLLPSDPSSQPPAQPPVDAGGKASLPPLPESGTAPSKEGAEVPEDSRATAAPSAEEGLFVRIEVLDEGGVAVPWATILVCWTAADESAWEEFQWSTDAAGVARVGPVNLEGAWSLEVRPEDEERLLSREIDPWEPADTTVWLPAPRTISGRVVDADGEHVPGAHVLLWQEISEDSADTHTDSAGRFAFRGLSREDVELGVLLCGRVTGADRHVSPGARDVVLVVDPGLISTVTIEDWPDYKGWLTIMLQDERTEEWRRFQGRPDERGRVWLPGLDPGHTYSFYLKFNGESTYALVRGLQAGGSAKARLDEGGKLTGQITWPRGAEPHHFYVWVKHRGVWVMGDIKKGARFELDGIPPGEWRVETRVHVGRGHLTGSALLTPGEPGVIESR